MEKQTQSEKEIFYAALELSDNQQRRELLDSACQGNRTLRSAVERLLAAHGGDRLPISDRPHAKNTSPIGQVVGNFKLLEKIGEGGFGDVYMANQLEPIQRRVALKIIKAGMDTHQVIARFEAERQALALMDHPNIAKVLDAGATESARPYFVMELVRGVPVTEYCDDRSLSTEERLSVFMQICSAVQHAHQKGIIHRDLKPPNILVTTDGDSPVPKVIDFGIAKATQGRLTEKTFFTQFRQFVGTPAYMSPEQAQMSAADVDTRSDLYSLGVLLYELLTGKTPLDTEGLLQAGLDEICRRIREDEPVRPSTRLSSLALDEQTTIAKHRRTEPINLTHKVQGDLDWIVMKALEKDRTRRYETASALHLDVRRYLCDEPVSAVAPSVIYTTSKFIRRNKSALAVAAVIIAMLVCGTAISSWQALRATQQAVRATAAENEAQMKERQATRLSKRAVEAERLARRSRYAAEMINAQRELRLSHSSAAWELLEKQIPRSNEPDFRGFEWRTLWNEFRRESTVLDGHTDEIRSLAFTPDGMYLASGSTDGTARLWDIKTGEEVWCNRSDGHCNCVSISPDGELLFTGYWRGDEGRALWDLSTPGPPRKLCQIDTGSGFFTPDGESLICLVPLTRWSLTGELLHEYGDPTLSRDSTKRAHQGRILDLAFFADGSAFVTASDDATAKIWNVATGELLSTLRGHGEAVTGVAFWSTMDNRIVTTSTDGTLRIWDTMGNGLLEVVVGNTPLVDLDFAKGGDSLLVSDERGQLRVFETGTWSVTAVFQSPGGSSLVSYSPQEPNVAVTAGPDGVIRVWNTAGTDSVLDHPNPVRALEFSPDGRTLAVGMQNGAVHFWDVPSKKRIHETKPTSTPGKGVGGLRPTLWRQTPFTGDFVKFSPSGNKVPIIGSWKAVTVLDIRTWNAEMTIEPPFADTLFWSLAFSTDGRCLYTGISQWGDVEVGVLVWDLHNPTKPVRKLAHSGNWAVRCVEISSRGKILASGHENVKLFDVATRLPMRTLEYPQRNFMERGPLGLCFSADGRWLAAGDAANRVCRVWDTKAWEPLELPHADIVTSVDFLPNSDRLVAAEMSGTTRLWDLEVRQEVATYDGSVADFSPTGEILAVGHQGRLYSTAMPAAGRVRLHFAPPIGEIDHRRSTSQH